MQGKHDDDFQDQPCPPLVPLSVGCPDCIARFGPGHENAHEATCPVGQGLAEAVADDARWFKANPGATLRLRPITWAERVDHEIQTGHPAPGWRIRVEQLAPGCRTRRVA